MAQGADAGARCAAAGCERLRTNRLSDLTCNPRLCNLEAELNHEAAK
jgi:hypothetical protein